MNYDRGIILGPDAQIDVRTNEVHIRTSEPNPGLLRHSLLYWDKIDFPQNNIIHVSSSSIDFLIKAGVAQSTQIRVGGSGGMAALYVAAQFAAFRELNSQNPDMWTFGQHAQEFSGLDGEITQAQIAEIEINSVLPTPPDDTPLEDILELKRKRESEFRSLRIAVDELYDEVLKSAQMPRAQSAAIYRLQSVIHDIRAVVDKSWLERVKSSVKFDFNLPASFGVGAAGYLSGQAASIAFGIPGLEQVGAAGAAALAAIKLDAKLGSVLKGLPESAKAFAYLYHVEKEFPGMLK
jgi:hypothetical protein